MMILMRVAQYLSVILAILALPYWLLVTLLGISFCDHYSVSCHIVAKSFFVGGLMTPLLAISFFSFVAFWLRKEIQGQEQTLLQNNWKASRYLAYILATLIFLLYGVGAYWYVQSLTSDYRAQLQSLHINRDGTTAKCEIYSTMFDSVDQRCEFMLDLYGYTYYKDEHQGLYVLTGRKSFTWFDKVSINKKLSDYGWLIGAAEEYKNILRPNKKHLLSDSAFDVTFEYPGNPRYSVENNINEPHSVLVVSGSSPKEYLISIIGPGAGKCYANSCGHTPISKLHTSSLTWEYMWNWDIVDPQESRHWKHLYRATHKGQNIYVWTTIPIDLSKENDAVVMVFKSISGT